MRQFKKMAIETSKWYASWFDTPYYHVLYKDRGHDEAKLFMKNLTTHLALQPGAKLMDLACGKGRHSIFLNKMGYDVTGVDLSEQSIAHAKQYENEQLHFDVHDMTLPYKCCFDAVFNLFTSFGYFDNEADNLKTIKAIRSNLKPGGYGVIDFMNTIKVKENLVAANTKEVDGITFELEREITNGYIVKRIRFEDNGILFDFEERVSAFELEDFELMINEAGGQLIETFGDYHLNPFDKAGSERLILIFK